MTSPRSWNHEKKFKLKISRIFDDDAAFMPRNALNMSGAQLNALRT
jgi:hypothetical protein